MKANVCCGALSLLLLVACNRPDSDLFGADPSSLPSDQPGVGGSMATGGVSSGGGSSLPAGGTSSPGSAAGGNAPVAGGPPGEQAAGSPNPPDPSGTAGASDGAGGSGEPPNPPEPVCGNGILEAGEQCDDAGHTGQDGCDADCKVVCSQFGAGATESEDHHCYNGYDSADFEGSQAACLKRGGHLVTISSADENDLVRGLVNNSKWIGGREDVPEMSEGTGAYSWVTNEPFTFTNWAAGEPDQAKVRCTLTGPGGIGGPAQNCYEHCVSMDGQGLWSDARCNVADGYICEWDPAGAKP
jgi:cysteine-rich repeat protein